MTTCPRISITKLPDAAQDVVFDDSTWFKTFGLTRRLPSPDEVKARSLPLTVQSRPLAKFDELDLVVKYGDSVTVSEALALRAVHETFGRRIPVPEVYGWKHRGREVYIYMELIRGPTLLEQWEHMDSSDKHSVCDHLRVILQALRGTEQDPSHRFIGQFAGGLLKDRILECQSQSGTWESVKSFHDWLSWLWRRHAPEPEQIDDPWRSLLSDDSPVVLTHGDLHQSNILVSSDSPTHVLAIIDWEQSGWYPDYWEYCKANYTVHEDEEWSSGGWIDYILKPHADAQEAFEFYRRAIGS